MNGIAPTCPISRSQPTQKVQPPGVDVNTIPRAHNLITVINAINRMTSVIIKLTRGEPQVNNVYPPNDFGYPTLKPEQPRFEYQHLNWIQEYRSYTDNEVVNPDDPSQKIKIKTLSSVHFRDTATGNQLIYFSG